MSTTYYTIKGCFAGFGMQYLCILSGIVYCKYKNYVYIHTPFIFIDLCLDVAKANNFIGIKQNFELYDNNCELIEKKGEIEVIKTPSIYFTNDVLEYIRGCYFKAEKPVIGPIDIAIHIRRGDVSKEENSERYTDNSFYVEIIKKLKVKYPTYTITIFSEGKYEDFNDLGLEENCLKLNVDIFETFHSLVCSKVLIQSLSTFSYCAGIINENIVYYHDSFWCKKLDNWLKLSDLRSEINI
jgi:hypothetical protein